MAAYLLVLASIVISALMSVGFIGTSVMASTGVATALTASQFSIAQRAAEKYVADFNASIAATATSTVPVTIPLQTLVSAGYLPGGYAVTNLFQQGWQIQVLQPSPGVLQAALESVGGNPITDPLQLVSIAARSTAQGGFIPWANQNGDSSMNPSNAYGAGGSWGPIALTSFTNAGSGHLFALLSFSGQQANSSYLYRVAVPGHPELTSMQTDLGLTDVSGNAHNINGIATVNAQDGQFSDRIGTGAYNATSGYPAGWAGGLHTWDVYGEGTLGAGKGGAIASSINSSGNVQGQVLLLGAIATPEQACGGTSASAIGTTVSVAIGSWAQNKDGSGQPLVCKLDPVSGSGPIWLPPGGRWEYVAQYPVSNGSVVPAPKCSAGGAGKMLLNAQTFEVDTTTAVNFGPSTGTGPWTVSITDGNGTGIAGSGMASTFCAY